ncbi:MAG: hypothetical protein ACFB4J_12965 [Elainellaceae cyanobacterium]
MPLASPKKSLKGSVAVEDYQGMLRLKWRFEGKRTSHQMEWGGTAYRRSAWAGPIHRTSSDN